MSQSKIRTQRATGPCPCGSNKQAASCCWRGTHFYRDPVLVELAKPDRNESMSGCYLEHLKSCEGKLSREHLVSEAVLDIIGRSDRAVRVSGASWIERETSKIVGLGALTSHCLCIGHNSDLAPLDAVAAQLFAEIQKVYEFPDGPASRLLISGHDLERWLLKTLFALVHSETLTHDRMKLPPGRLHPSIDVARMLSSPSSWARGTGLHCLVEVGDNMKPESQISVAPLSDGNGYIIGMNVTIQAVALRLFAAPPPPGTYTRYRPGAFRFLQKFSKVVELSWDDDLRHGDVVFGYNPD